MVWPALGAHDVVDEDVELLVEVDDFVDFDDVALGAVLVGAGLSGARVVGVYVGVYVRDHVVLGARGVGCTVGAVRVGTGARVVVVGRTDVVVEGFGALVLGCGVVDGGVGFGVAVCDGGGVGDGDGFGGDLVVEGAGAGLFGSG